MAIAAAIQMASGTIVHANLTEAGRLITAAARAGAELIVLPENFGLMAMTAAERLLHAEVDGDGPMQNMLSRYAAAHNVWIVGGTIPISTDDPNRAMQTCFLYNAKGEQIARYDKNHLFDVMVSSDENYFESLSAKPGTQPVVIDTPFGRLGLSVCYDLRFPELYRLMLQDGMEIAAVPAAFAKSTGSAHWDILVKARAIENIIFVVAAAQGGYHVNGQQTYGHSMIVDPWGETIGPQLRNGAGFVLAEIQRNNLQELRKKLPSVDRQVLGGRLSSRACPV